jgi:hypothetical protein
MKISESPPYQISATFGGMFMDNSQQSTHSCTDRLDLQLKYTYILLCKECLKWSISRSDESYIFFKTYHKLGPLRHMIQYYRFPGLNICHGLIFFTTLSVHIQHTWKVCEYCNYALIILQAMSGPIYCFKIANT